MTKKYPCKILTLILIVSQIYLSSCHSAQFNVSLDRLFITERGMHLNGTVTSVRHRWSDERVDEVAVAVRHRNFQRPDATHTVPVEARRLIDRLADRHFSGMLEPSCAFRAAAARRNRRLRQTRATVTFESNPSGLGAEKSVVGFSVHEGILPTTSDIVD